MARRTSTHAGRRIDDATTVTSAEWQQLCLTMNGYIYSQTLVTACELDLFTYLSAHPGATVKHIAPALGISAYGARVLLLACSAAHLVVRATIGDGYCNSSLSQRVLVANAETSMLDFVKFNYVVQQRCSAHFTAALREGRNAGLDEFPGDGATLYERLGDYPELEALFQRAMGAYTKLSPKMTDLHEFGAVRRLLDVAGGDGTNAIRLCRKYPKMRVTLAERPNVVRIATEKVAAAGLTGRIDCVPVDIFTDRWPVGNDSALLSHVVEIFSPEAIQALYRAAYESLPDKGRVFVWAMMADDAETGGLQAAKSSIYFLTAASGQGMAYPGVDHERWLRASGFPTTTRYPVPELDHGAIVAEK